MTKLLDVIVVASFLVLTLKGALPDLLDHEWMQRSALVLFGASVPVVFALSLWAYFSHRTKEALARTLVFLFLFSVVTGLVVAGSVGSKFAYHNLRTMESQHPAEVFNGLVEARDIESRRAAARIIYISFGGKVPYRVDEGSYKVFGPTAKDQKDREEIQKMRRQAAQMNDQLMVAHIQSLWSGFYLIASFFVIFSLTMTINHFLLTQRST